MRSRKTFLLLLIALVLVGLCVYGVSVSNVFLLDDFHVIKNNVTITKLSSLRYYLRHYFNRSLFYTSLVINYRFSGDNPLGYQWTNLVLHTVNAGLVYCFVSLCYCVRKRVEHSPWIPFLAGAIFLLHPIQATTIHQIANRSIMLCTFFYLLSLISFLAWQTTQKRMRYLFSFLRCALLFFMSWSEISRHIVTAVVFLFVDFFQT